MKVQSSVKRRCPGCRIIRRKGVVRVTCKSIRSTNSDRGRAMARIAGVDIPREKRVEVALTYIYGIGLSTSQKILEKTQIAPGTRVDALTEGDVAKLRSVIESEHKVEGNLRSEVAMNIKRFMDIGCYRGLRWRRGLPVRGQRTRTNARTRKGPKKGQISLKKKRDVLRLEQGGMICRPKRSVEESGAKRWIRWGLRTSRQASTIRSSR